MKKLWLHKRSKMRFFPLRGGVPKKLNKTSYTQALFSYLDQPRRFINLETINYKRYNVRANLDAEVTKSFCIIRTFRSLLRILKKALTTFQYLADLQFSLPTIWAEFPIKQKLLKMGTRYHTPLPVLLRLGRYKRIK